MNEEQFRKAVGFVVEVVRNIKYKDWKFYVLDVPLSAYGPVARVQVSQFVPDSTTGEKIRTAQTTSISLGRMTVIDVLNQAMQIVIERETHEVMEFFTFDGYKPFYPHPKKGEKNGFTHLSMEEF